MKEIQYNNGKHETVNEGFVRMYYNHQYDRIAQLEQHGLTITSIVATLVVVALTFGFSKNKDLTLVTGIALPLTMTILNGFAIFYIKITGNTWIVHQ